MTKKKPELNPIEEAVGDRAKPKPEFQEEPIPQPLEQAQIPDEPSPTETEVLQAAKQIFQNPGEILDEPSPSEMLTLEELNRQTEERFRDEPGGGEIPTTITTPKSPIPVSKPDPQPATKTCSEESPPQKIDEKPWDKIGADTKFAGESCNHIPAEDIEFTALKKYIREDGFVLATVAFHIVSLCAQPMTTPSTTTWDFKDRAMIPDMVLALLNQPGYLEGIWPSLKIVMGSNVGNAAWCSGIATTIAFFDCIRTLPALKELQNDS